MLKALQIGLMLIVTCVAVGARADVVSFDDLSDNGTGQLILNGYHGFQWDNFYVLNVKKFSALPYMGANGYAAGLVSGTNVAFNGYGVDGEGAPALVHNGLFTFNSASFNAAWSDDLTITVTGKRAGNTIAEQSFTVNATGPATKEEFNWSGIDELDFQASGGTHHAGYKGTGAHFSMDNFDVAPLGAEIAVADVPEPNGLVSLAGLGGAAVALGVIGGWRRRRSTAIAGR
jgi:hypothetical protein